LKAEPFEKALEGRLESFDKEIAESQVQQYKGNDNADKYQIGIETTHAAGVYSGLSGNCGERKSSLANPYL